MKTPRMPSPEHTTFDAICAPIDDFEPLPTVTAELEQEHEDWEEPEVPLDGLILAGLVAPH
jgi:hypothetical protein